MPKDSHFFSIYPAPELIAGQAQPAPRTDVYSMGMTLNELITGTQPFAKGNFCDTIMSFINRSQILDSQSHPLLLPDVSALLDKCLCPQPEERYQNTTELSMALKKSCTRASRFEITFVA